MLGLNRQQRAVLADKVPEAMNITSGAIVIAFSIGDIDASWIVLAVALGLWIVAMVFAVWIMRHRT
jgi:type IV secretory pathway TrbD component